MLTFLMFILKYLAEKFGLFYSAKYFLWAIFRAVDSVNVAED